MLKTPQHVMASAMDGMFKPGQPDWDSKEVSDRVEKLVFIDLAGIKNLAHPGTAIDVLGELDRFLLGLDSSGDQEIDY